MINLLNGSIIQFVAEAIEGKYPEMDNAILAQEVKGAYKDLSTKPSLEDVVASSKTIQNPEDDIYNQVAALVAIKKFNHAKNFNEAPLRLLHRIVYSRKSQEMLRRGKKVADFPGNVPTDVACAAERFSELELAVITLGLLQISDRAVAATLLAYVFSAIIRIHAFEDGNGRLARLAVQFLLARWGMPLIPLPKVRNDFGWKAALGSAIAGDLKPLTYNIDHRLREADRRRDGSILLP